MSRADIRPALAVALGLVLALVLVLAGCTSKPIPLIATFNLTGPESVLDLPCYRGAVVATQEINRNGGVLGRPLELIPVDTRSDDGAAAHLARSSVHEHPAAAAGLGYCDSSFVLAVGPAFADAGIPFVTPGATDSTLPERLGGDVFLACYSDAAQAAAMAQYAFDTLGLRRVAVWTNEQADYTRTVAEHFERSFTALGGTVRRWAYPDDASDYGALIEAFRREAGSFDAIYSASKPVEGEAQIGQIRAAGIRVPLLSGDGWDDPKIFALSRQRGLTGLYFSTHRFLGVDTPEMRAFVAAYEGRFGAAPENAFAPLGYDTVNLIADAIRRMGSADARAVSRGLASTRGFPGIVGPITFAAGTHVPVKPVEIIRIDRGEQTPVAVVTPASDERGLRRDGASRSLDCTMRRSRLEGEATRITTMPGGAGGGRLGCE